MITGGAPYGHTGSGSSPSDVLSHEKEHRMAEALTIDSSRLMYA